MSHRGCAHTEPVRAFTTIRYEVVDGNIARITLARADKRNAQNHAMTNELDEAFSRAAADDDIKVILLDADGPHFCAGHDQINRGPTSDIDTTGMWYGYDLPGIEGFMSWTKEAYFDAAWRWRNIPKPVFCAAQGKTIGGGLTLLWVCDVIIASDDASFADPTPFAGVNGIEYFGHPWEFGARKAKELLFTSEYLTAEEARQVGMVNRVVPRAELSDATLELARKAAKKPSIALKLAKAAVNGALDSQGQHNALTSAFWLNAIGHAQMQLVGRPDDYGEGFLNIRTGRVRAADATKG